MFGLPPMTVFVAFGIPILVSLGLLLWGLSVRLEDEENDGDKENRSS
jgi:hypothetical protein